jgi:hypothetical protein
VFPVRYELGFISEDGTLRSRRRENLYAEVLHIYDF